MIVSGIPGWTLVAQVLAVGVALLVAAVADPPPVRFTHVRRYRRGLASNDTRRRVTCLHCGRRATVAAVRVRLGRRLPVRYCDEHATEAGIEL